MCLLKGLDWTQCCLYVQAVRARPLHCVTAALNDANTQCRKRVRTGGKHAGVSYAGFINHKSHWQSGLSIHTLMAIGDLCCNACPPRISKTERWSCSLWGNQAQHLRTWILLTRLDRTSPELLQTLSSPLDNRRYPHQFPRCIALHAESHRYLKDRLPRRLKTC